MAAGPGTSALPSSIVVGFSASGANFAPAHSPHLAAEFVPVGLRQLPYASLEAATNGFSAENRIGSGSCGVVFEGVLPQMDNAHVALKCLTGTGINQDAQFLQELAIPSMCRHEHLLPLLAASLVRAREGVWGGVGARGRRFSGLCPSSLSFPCALTPCTPTPTPSPVRTAPSSASSTRSCRAALCSSACLAMTTSTGTFRH